MRPTPIIMTTSKLVRWIIGIVAVLVALPMAQATHRVGVLLKAKSTFWKLAESGALEAGAALGAEIVTKAPPRESDIEAQIQLFTTLVEEGCNAIVVAPNSTEALGEVIFAARARGVVIVVIDTRLAPEVAPVFVGVDQVEAGRTAGRLVAGMVSDGDVVCIFRHNQTSGATAQREEGALEALRAARQNLVLPSSIYSSTERGMETTRANLLLTQNPEVKAILASGTPGTMAMLYVLQERGLAGKIHLVGFGYNLNRSVVEALERGTLDAWIAQVPEEMGRKAVETAVALLNAEKVEPVVHTRFEVITKDNVRDLPIRALMVD